MAMDPLDPIYLEDEDTPLTKTLKGATQGLVMGLFWGTFVGSWKDLPLFPKHNTLPGMIKSLKFVGSHGLTFATIGGIFIGVEQLMEHFRVKRDYINGAVGGFAAGSSVFGWKARSISTAVSAGTALAATSALVDAFGRTTGIKVAEDSFPERSQRKAEVTTP